MQPMDQHSVSLMESGFSKSGFSGIKPRALARFWITAILFGVCLGARPGSMRATVPAGFAETLLATGIREPTALAANRSDGRVFIGERGGRILVLTPGDPQLRTYAQLPLKTAEGEALLGIASVNGL